MRLANEGEPQAAFAHKRPSLAALAGASFKVGCLGFGGPAGQIALMHRVYIEEKAWIDEPRYLHALNYCMLLPGPEAQQLATYVGWLLRGIAGGVISGLLFILPGAFIVFLLSWAYMAHAGSAWIDALFFGVKAAVLAFVLDALVRLGRKALKTHVDWAIAALAFLALYLFGVPFPVVILAAGLAGLIAARSSVAATGPPLQPAAQPKALGAVATGLIWAFIWLAPLGASIAVFGPDHLLSEIGMFFSQLALITFGGAYAVLAYVQQHAVEARAWLSPQEMIDGLGLAETTPGPLILVNQFVGFLAGWKQGGLSLAAAAAAMASWCTFAPSFVWIFAGAPFAERLRASRSAAGALRGATASVFGVFLGLGLWFGLHVLFTRRREQALPWGHEIHVPSLAHFELAAAGIALIAACALIRFRVNAVLVVLGAAAMGAAWRLLGP